MDLSISYRNLRTATLVILIMLSFSISNTAQTSKINKGKITGVWLFADYLYAEQHMVYKRFKALGKDSSGFQFLPAGLLTSRRNSGFCGTPPIQYRNYGGSWKFTSDSTITIRYKFWGGVSEEDWKIIELSQTTLIVKREKEETIWRKKYQKKN